MTSPSGERWACDTSVAIAALDPLHAAHTPCRQALVDLRPALAGHAAFETYSVLTRLPVPLRLSAAQADRVLTAAFPDGCWLDGDRTSRVRRDLAVGGIIGGSVYDALVAEAAAGDGRTLLTRDKRAARTYRMLRIAHRFVE